MMRMAFSKNFLTKIFVVRDEDTIFGKRFLNHIFIADTARFFVNRENIVFLLAQPSRDFRARAFVNNETHLHRLQH